MPASWQPRLAKLGALTVIYVAAGKLGLSMAILHPSASPVWPPTGFALAALLLLGRAVWPAIAVGAFIVNITTAGTVWTSLGIATGNTLEAILGAFLVERFANGRHAFDRTLDLLKFALLAGFLATLVSATIGVTSLCLTRAQLWSEYGSTWWTWWLGDVGGALIIAPPLILWGSIPRARWSRWRVIEGVCLLLCIGAVGEVAFLGHLFPRLSAHPLAFLCVPPLLWPALRFGRRETATACILLAAIATWATLTGRGPYAAFGPNAALLLLQAFLVFTMLTALTLATVVRERARASEMLHEKAQELERSNADLEQFAYAASHDLQEPLRNVLLYIQLFDRDFRGKLGSDADEYLRIASSSATRMLELIRELLAYARIGTRGGSMQPVDAEEVVRGVLDDMRSAIDESRALVTVGPLPRIHADPRQLGQVFQNLVANAIKFRGTDPPRVEIQASPRDKEWIFLVRDNGIGIEAAYRERIFEIFQRLHARDRYPGSGIGLAICKRVLQRHGGRIWVESEPGKGSSFFFMLPSNGAARMSVPTT